MRKMRRQGAVVLLAFAAGSLQAQQPSDPKPAAPTTDERAPADLQIPAAPCASDPVVAPAEDRMAEPAQHPTRKKKKGGLARDVSRATGASAGQVAGAAVAGPVGAAAVGVVGEKVGDVVGSIVKGGKKDRKESAQGEGTPSRCATGQQAAQPGR